MPYAISHQTATDHSEENCYRVPSNFMAYATLHETSDWIRGKVSGHKHSLECFFDLERPLNDLIAPREEEEAYNSFIKTVSLLTACQDPYTAEHQNRVSELAGGIAREMGLVADMVEGISVAGLVHDMGKMSVPAEIVTKPGALTPLESLIMKEHPQRAYAILKEIKFPWPIPEIVLQHHERLNGSGYPQRLKGKEILLEARVLVVADVVEAISSDRHYRPDLGIDAALEEIDKNKEILYDTEVTEACLRVLKGDGCFHG